SAMYNDACMLTSAFAWDHGRFEVLKSTSLDGYSTSAVPCRCMRLRLPSPRYIRISHSTPSGVPLSVGRTWVRQSLYAPASSSKKSRTLGTCASDQSRSEERRVGIECGR